MKLTINDLSFAYEQGQILKNLSLAMAEGEFVTILGSSGSGKSTLLKLLTGILHPDSGKIQIDNQESFEISKAFAYMPQEDLLFPWKTILENVCFYGAIHGNKKAMERRAMELLPVFGLTGYGNAYPKELSGGMKQRAAFLRTALCEGSIMLLDEPFGALDVITRGDMQDWLASMRRNLGKTILLVTHDIDEAIYLSDRILILRGSPSTVVREIKIDAAKRSRSWLYSQGELRKTIYHAIKGDETNVI